MSKPRVNPPPEELYAKKNKIFAIMMIGWAMSLLDVSIVNVSVPELQSELDADVDSITWVVNAYNIAFASLLIVAGKLADLFGRRLVFMIGMGVFTLGSFLCAISGDIDLLIIFRVVQGLGAGILAPIGFAITAAAFPLQERGKALATIAVVALAAAASGPAVGGAIVELFSWEWIFLVNIPFGILGIVLARRVWPETYDLEADRRIDFLGMGLLVVVVFCLTFGLVEANHRGWDDGLILFLLQSALLLGVAFVLSQRREGALISPSLTGNRQFVGANAAMALFGGAALGTLLVLALVFVNLWGFTIFEAALGLMPVPLFGLVIWPKIAAAADSRPPRDLAVPALLVMAVGLLWMSFVPSVWEGPLSYVAIFPALALIGAGVGTCFPTINVGAMGAVQGQELGLASGIVNTARQIGAAVGIAILIATFSATLDLHVGSAHDDVEEIADDAQIPPPVYGGLMQADLINFAGGAPERDNPAAGFDEDVFRRTAGAARNAYGWAFRAALLLALLAVPFALTMRRYPAQVRAEAMAAMKAQQQAQGDGRAGPGPPDPTPGAAGPQPAG